MNREQRRQFNKTHKTNFTANDFLLLDLVKQTNEGNIDINNEEILSKYSRVINIDNVEIVPEDTCVKLYYKGIQNRLQQLTPALRKFIEHYKDTILHVTREKASNSLVCVKEDIGFLQEKEGIQEANLEYVPWLWSIYDDFLYEDEFTGDWVILTELLARQEEAQNKKNKKK